MNYIYAIGKVEYRFPSLDVRREFYRCLGSALPGPGENEGEEVYSHIHKVLSENLPLAQELCWVLTVGDFDTYILQPRTPRELRLLVDAIATQHFNYDKIQPEKIAYDLLIGVQQGAAIGECGSLRLPLVIVDNIQTFREEAIRNFIHPMIQSLNPTQPQENNQKMAQQMQISSAFEDIATQTTEMLLKDMLERVLYLTNNIGRRDESRALNYVVTNDLRLYTQAAQKFYSEQKRVTDIRVERADSNDGRTICNVIIDYTHYQTQIVEQFFIPVDVTGKWPFMVNTIQPYYGCC